MSTGKNEIDAWQVTPYPIAPIGAFKRELISLARDGLKWRNAKRKMHGGANLKGVIARAVRSKVTGT